MADFLQVLATGIQTTVLITAGAFGVGVVLGLPLALLRRSRNWLLRAPVIAVVEVIRAVPPIVWLFLVYYGLSSDLAQLSTFQAAVGGLGLIAAAYMSEIYRAGIEAVPDGQWEAGRALALPNLSLYRRVVLPQALVVVIPPAATYAIALLKDSAIASVIGAQDITFHAFQETQASLQGLSVFATAGLLYIVLSLPIAAVARYADRALVQRMAA
jgi:polar amino acid transport system permease protein